MTNVRLVDLDVFKRYSLAIRQEAAPAEEVLAVLDASRRQVMAAAGGAGVTAPATDAGYREAPDPVVEEDDVADDWAPDPAAWAATDPATDTDTFTGAGAEEEMQEPPEPGRATRRRVRRTAGPAPGANR